MANAESPCRGSLSRRAKSVRTTRSHKHTRGHAMCALRDAHCPRPPLASLSPAMSLSSLWPSRDDSTRGARQVHTPCQPTRSVLGPALPQALVGLCGRGDSAAARRAPQRSAAVGSKQSSQQRRAVPACGGAGGPSGVTSCNHPRNERAAALGWHSERVEARRNTASLQSRSSGANVGAQHPQK